MVFRSLLTDMPAGTFSWCAIIWGDVQATVQRGSTVEQPSSWLALYSEHCHERSLRCCMLTTDSLLQENQ